MLYCCSSCMWIILTTIHTCIYTPKYNVFLLHVHALVTFSLFSWTKLAFTDYNQHYLINSIIMFSIKNPFYKLTFLAIYKESIKVGYMLHVSETKLSSHICLYWLLSMTETRGNETICLPLLLTEKVWFNRWSP